MQAEVRKEDLIEAHLARLKRAAEAISRADALIIGAGAGMSVDSGLPDYRGTTGFWKAYPPFRGRTYQEIAGPQLIRDDPQQAWGFYGHCLSLYRSTIPHAGFQILKRWAEQIVGEYFVFTSNIDGHFEREGFSSIVKRLLAQIFFCSEMMLGYRCALLSMKTVTKSGLPSLNLRM